MKIEKIYINNFRSIEEAHVSFKDFTLLIGNNGTGKTSILEALNFILSPNFLSGRIKQTDFYKGTNEPIIIELEFCKPFEIEIPDGYHKQPVSCKAIYLEIKKREKSAPGKSFSDGFVIKHHYVPIAPKANDTGWEQQRQGGSIFKFTERQLALNYAESSEGIKSFYFNKNRSIQLRKGYNSSVSSLFDDFNWRFSKEINKNDDGYFDNKNNLEGQIISKIDDKAIKKSITALNGKLNDFGLPNIDISFIYTMSPFDSAFLSYLLENLEIPVDDLGSGVEMIVSLLFLETMAALSKDNILIIIDEPELHLHPSFQKSLIQYLKTISKENQIIVSTHSPYFFVDCFSDNSIKMLVTKIEQNKCLINDANFAFTSFPWSPSWGEINYYAYDLPTIQFHNELYGYIQSKSNIEKPSQFDIYLAGFGYPQVKNYIREQGGTKKTYNLTLMSYIRHLIHHPENKNNTPYTHDELKQSISQMIDIIDKIKCPF